MRISDWSSDVCSSDLPQVPVLYLRKLGKGAVLYLTLGHCRGHYDMLPATKFWPHPQRCGWNYPIFHELLRRGIRWGMPGMLCRFLEEGVHRTDLVLHNFQHRLDNPLVGRPGFPPDREDTQSRTGAG